MTSVSRLFSFKALGALTLAVLLVHMVLLQGVATRPDPTRMETLHVFSTRSIEANPPLALVTAVPVRSPVTVPPGRNSSRSGHPERLAAADRHASSEDSIRPEPAETTGQTATDQVPQVAGATDSASAGPPPPETRAVWAAALVPDSTRLRYQVLSNNFPYSLNAELRWQHNSGRYEAQLEISAFGLSRLQTSRGQITPDGLAPLRFSDKYRSEVAAHFNREAGKVTFSANTPDLPLMAGAQDRLSIMMQLAARIAANPGAFPASSNLLVQTIGPRDGSNWLFTVGEKETLSLPGGELATLKLVRQPGQDFDQRLELWLAPALGYLPARIRITEFNGDYIDQKWLATEPQR